MKMRVNDILDSDSEGMWSVQVEYLSEVSVGPATLCGLFDPNHHRILRTTLIKGVGGYRSHNPRLFHSSR